MKRICITLFFALAFQSIGFSQAFLEALKEDDTTQMQVLLAENANLADSCFDIGKSNYTPLMLAIKFDIINGLKLLLKERVDLEKACGDKKALMYCAKYGKLEMAKLLVEAGANLSTEYNGRTPLGYAKRYEKENLEEYLSSF